MVAITALVAAATGLAGFTRASPSVNVALQASFDSAPYLLELLETAAEENTSAYFPLLDRIADGAFDDATTDQDLYKRFLTVAHDDGHLRTPESLSSFKLSLAVRSAAPRISAHYQFYNTSVQDPLLAAQDAACPVWVYLEGKQYCSSAMERAQQDVLGEEDSRVLPFDRVFGDASLSPAILYADIASPIFKEFHQSLTALAKEGQLSYRVRYRPPQHWIPRPLFVSGYGVELALKRTDYIVVDDRDAEQKRDIEDTSKKAKEDAPDDLKPLSSSEVARLGLNTASYVMDSDSPLDSLVELSQDFPKYSSQVATHDASRTLVDDIREKRGRMLPAGANIMWINGIQMDTRKIDAFSLLDHLRRERRLIEKFRDLDIPAKEAVDLLSHPLLGEALMEDAPQRFNYRDEVDGGHVIIWMNDLEEDGRYNGWPNEIAAYLQRTFPGQLPPVRRNLHNMVVPVDLSDLDDVQLVVGNIQMFVKRKIPVRMGLVPTTLSPGSTSQLKVAQYLQETFGLSSMLQYLEESASKKTTSSPDAACFQTATKDRDVRREKQRLSLEEVLASDKYENIVSRTVSYQNRLGVGQAKSDFYVNGIPIARGETWMQDLSKQISRDLQLAQQNIFEHVIENDTWLPGFFLSDAFDRRNSLIVPQDSKDVQILDIGKIADLHRDTINDLPRLASEKENVLDSVQMIVVGDFDSENGSQLLTAALNFREGHGEAEALFLHNPTQITSTGKPVRLYKSLKERKNGDTMRVLADIHDSEVSDPEAATISQTWAAWQPLAADLGFTPGTNGVVLNGRAVGPVPDKSTLTVEDFSQLLRYEKTRRITPVARALDDLEYGPKLSSPLAFAKLTSLAALSTISDVPEGIFDSPQDVRVNLFSKWTPSESVFTVSNSDDPTINIVASIDPTSEVAQKWLPILKVLSKLDGVQLKIFLNPRDKIQELPIKRFYRYVLDSEPTFAANGSLERPTASFAGVPVEALFTLGMDVASSWLVAPKGSLHDLDNIKLGSLKSGSNVDAVYALEHILIEGHSRDMTDRSPPSGVQLNLGTEKDPYFSDTIIMANLGYFQFKSQPGLWKISLKPGRSQSIFNLDSVGGLGYSPQAGDESNEVALLSFQGVTLFPRLSRKKGQENEDVLETGPKPGSAMDYVSKGLNFASNVLSNVGVSTGKNSQEHADINIFSVASGHLYERMLNIMMVSVMKNTNHSVKFWFIEQFLSPSFKSFLPHLAKEYNFRYEMVTFKWPHWLRAQKEKQREIWGYKILFLDVLFPLSLEKVIFVDADQIVRTDMYDLVTHPITTESAPYAFPPMGDSRTEIEGFRFWKQGYWQKFLRGKPYHISALYLVDLTRFRALAAGDRLRGQYQMLSADPGSLSNLDQDLPNNMQHNLPIHTLPVEWLWCETWCSDADLENARTIDLCNNPQTKEPKLDRARRQVPEWTVYDEEIAGLVERVRRQEEALARDAENGPGDDDGGESGWPKDEL